MFGAVLWTFLLVAFTMFALRCHLPNHTNGGALHVHVVRPADIFANIGTFFIFVVPS
jgi:hypothetical protein